LKIVLLKRNAFAPTNPGKWGLPGGTMEPGENDLQCITRELVEECNVGCLRLKYLTCIDDVAFYQDEAIIYPITKYLATESDGIGLFTLYEISRLSVCKEHMLAIEYFMEKIYDDKEKRRYDLL
jgi:8-oxo-dGTP pyrophosphatase MutT (NUDIX family)